MTETSEDAFERAAAAGVALKREWPATPDAERVRDALLVGQAQRLVAEARRVITANRANGANGHALVQPAGAEHITKAELSALARGLRLWLDPELRALEKRLLRVIGKELGKELGRHDQLISELKRRGSLKYHGVWDSQQTYVEGDFCTDDGSVWHCESPCSGVRPGSAAGVWTLAVKHGRDLRK